MIGFLFRSIPLLAVAGILYYISSLPSLDPPGLGIVGEDKLLHVGAWIILTFAARPIAGRIGKGSSVGRKAWIAFGIAVIYGIIDEIHQSYVPGRNAEVADWFADCIGAAIGAWFLVRYDPVVRRKIESITRIEDN